MPTRPTLVPSLEQCSFYQTIELPELGVVPGAWDHRGTADTYLGYVDFQGKTALDIGPANGFFSFEMESLGASRVTALDLGQSADWDAVPSPSTNRNNLKESLRRGVRRVENAFWLSHQALDSDVRLVHGSAYDTPRVVDAVDIALIGNVLQHVRDPFLAIERVCEAVHETIIISEAIWIDEPSFLTNPDMRLLARADVPELNQSWWAVSPAAVVRTLELLNFDRIRCELHEQEYSLRDRRVRHFTITGTRPRAETARREADQRHVYFADGWHAEERNERESWHWSSARAAAITVTCSPGECAPMRLDFRIVSLQDAAIEVWTDGRRHSRLDVCAHRPIELNVGLPRSESGRHRVELISTAEASTRPDSAARAMSFGVFNLSASPASAEPVPAQCLVRDDA